MEEIFIISKNEYIENLTKEEIKDDIEKFEYIEGNENQFIIKSEDSVKYKV